MNKQYKITFQDGDAITYRTLSAGELEFLDSIENESTREERAGILASGDNNIPWQKLFLVGRRAIKRSKKTITDDTLFEIKVLEARKKISSNKSALSFIAKILQYFPNQSITELLDKTYDELIELLCLCEHVSGQQIIPVGRIKKRGQRIVNPKAMKDGGKALQEKMNELNNSLGGQLRK